MNNKMTKNAILMLAASLKRDEAKLHPVDYRAYAAMVNAEYANTIQAEQEWLKK